LVHGAGLLLQFQDCPLRAAIPRKLMRCGLRELLPDRHEPNSVAPPCQPYCRPRCQQRRRPRRARKPPCGKTTIVGISQGPRNDTGKPLRSPAPRCGKGLFCEIFRCDRQSVRSLSRHCLMVCCIELSRANGVVGADVTADRTTVACVEVIRHWSGLKDQCLCWCRQDYNASALSRFASGAWGISGVQQIHRS
jgi:hypothetical protein